MVSIKMEFKDLYPVVILLVMVGMLLGIGVLVFSLFGDAAKEDALVLDESISIASGRGTTANDDLVSIQNFGNESTELVALRSAADFNFSKTGEIRVNSSFLAGDYIVNYTYGRDTTTTDVLDDSISAVGAISTTWLPLIITVLVLAIILTLVLRSFGTAGRR